MATILLVIHLIIALVIIVLVLLQRSEGGALGIGGGGGGNSFMSTRALGNALTRTTAFLAVLFFATSIGLSLLAKMEKESSVLDHVIEEGGRTNDFQSPLPALPAIPEPE